VPGEEVALALRHSGKLVTLKGDVTEEALIRDVQWDTYGIHVLHLDLMRVSATETVEVKLSIHLKGEAAGAKDGGVVNFVTHEVEIDCPASAIPEHLVLSLAKLQVGEALHASDIELPAGASLVTNPQTIIATCNVPREEEEAPVVADAESGFGGVLNAFELMKAMIEAGAAGVHFEDQLASVKKCGHMGGKVLVPTQEAVQKLVAARLAADTLGVPTVLLARTDAEAADIVTSDVDENDKPFITGERTSEGFFKTRKGFDQALSRGLAYAEYADMVWCETGTPDLDFARKFAEGIQKKYPGKMLAYNCSPSFNWKRNLDDATIARFQRELGAMGYKFQFITLAGFHSLNYSMFELAYGYARNNMSAFVELQQKEFAAAEKGFTAVKHQREVGTGYFDQVTQTVTGGKASTTALHGSTEDEQFFNEHAERAGGSDALAQAKKAA
jgi:ribosomal protein bL25 (Ctc-form)